MKIVLATPLYPPEIGGPATYTKELAERLVKGNEVIVVALASSDAVAAPGTKLIVVEKDRPLPVRLGRYFVALLRASRGADLIYAQNAVAAGFPAMLVGMLRHIPVVIKFVGDEAWERTRQAKLTDRQLEEFLARPDKTTRYISLLKKVQGWTLRNVSLVTTPSRYLRDTIVRAYHIPEESAVVNYNATDETTSGRTPAFTRHQIVATARLVEWKGIDGIIRAVGILKDRYPDIKLLIAGDGPSEDSLKKLTKELGLEDRITFLGKVGRDETRRIRSTSHVYVLNSTYEGLPHTVLTSFSAGIPTIATDIPGTNEAVIDGETGLLVPAGDDKALAAQISRLFEDDELCKKVVSGATEMIKERFSWEAHLAILEENFARLAGK
jgi:glycosyltransferase involved in cell wall biosynthesis